VAMREQALYTVAQAQLPIIRGCHSSQPPACCERNAGIARLGRLARHSTSPLAGRGRNAAAKLKQGMHFVAPGARAAADYCGPFVETACLPRPICSTLSSINSTAPTVIAESATLNAGKYQSS